METVQKVLNQAALVLKNPNFIARHRLKPTAFTRRRKLPFERIVGTLIHLVRNSLQSCLQQAWGSIFTWMILRRNKPLAKLAPIYRIPASWS